MPSRPFSSSPKMLTCTRAVRRSCVVSTAVTVAKEIRGSFSSSLMIWPSSRCSRALTRSVRLYGMSLPRLRLDDVRLDDVADRHVVAAFEHDAALEARIHLAGVVLEPLQRADLPVPGDGAAAHDPDRKSVV